MALLKDWGESCVDRVFACGADLSDLAQGAAISVH